MGVFVFVIIFKFYFTGVQSKFFFLFLYFHLRKAFQYIMFLLNPSLYTGYTYDNLGTQMLFGKKKGIKYVLEQNNQEGYNLKRLL